VAQLRKSGPRLFAIRELLVQSINRQLDRTVSGAHRCLPGNYHPYFLAEDTAALSLIGIGFAFGASFGVLRPCIHALAITMTFVLYVCGFLRLKRLVTGTGARSTLQDSLLFVAPVYLGLSWAMRQDMRAALDILAFSLLLAVGFMRIGCFLGGCCHGRPARLGVFYSSCVLRSVNGARLFTPAPAPGCRVFPLQLVEAGIVFMTAGLLWLRESSLVRPDGSALALAAIVYSGQRFISEFFRGHRHRPKYLRLSEAQWLSLVIIGISALLLFIRA